MKVVLKKEHVRLYLLLAAVYSAFVLLMDLVYHPETFWERVLNNTWLILFIIPNNYILFEYTIPFFRRSWRRLLWLPLLLAVHLFFYSVGVYGWRHFGVMTGLYIPIGTFKNCTAQLEFLTGYSMGSVFFFGITRHIYYYNRLRQAEQRLRIEKQEAELNFLKAQTNPHFLFNTLNNIYALARDKSSQAPESILRLSKLLRFMLYEAGGSFIAVEQELKIISDYIELEKLRYDDSLRVNFNYDLEDSKQAIPPLLLIPLVENAFKHGVSETRGRPFVDIHLTLKERRLQFVVKNSTELPKDATPVREHIGLSNLRRQLELLYKEYKLELEQGELEFKAVLTINLASHV